jgi:hypothetical protein
MSLLLKCRLPLIYLDFIDQIRTAEDMARQRAPFLRDGAPTLAARRPILR